MKTVVFWNEFFEHVNGVIGVENYDEKFAEFAYKAWHEYYAEDDKGRGIWKQGDTEYVEYVLQEAEKHGYRCRKIDWIAVEAETGKEIPPTAFY